MQTLRKYQYLTRLFGAKNYKYFIGYVYNDNKFKPLRVMRSIIISAYVKNYDGQTKWMYFLIEDDDILGKCNTIWDKDSTDIKKRI